MLPKSDLPLIIKALWLIVGFGAGALVTFIGIALALRKPPADDWWEDQDQWGK